MSATSGTVQDPALHGAVTTTCQHDFSDTEGFLAKKWGPIIWRMMHVFGVYADQADQAGQRRVAYRALLRRWIAQLTAVLFCGTCRQRFEGYLAAHPLTAFADPAQSCAALTFDLHNAVNCKLARSCLSSGQFDTMRKSYEATLDYRGTGLLSPEWQLTFALALLLAALNFPAAYNPELPRHRMLEQSYREWVWLCFALIPDTQPANRDSFARKCKAALDQPYRAHATLDGVHYYTPAVGKADQDASASASAAYTYATFLDKAPLSRAALYHWVYDLTTLIWGAPVFGTCTATHQHIEHDFRFEEPTGRA